MTAEGQWTGKTRERDYLSGLYPNFIAFRPSDSVFVTNKATVWSLSGEPESRLAGLRMRKLLLVIFILFRDRNTLIEDVCQFTAACDVCVLLTCMYKLYLCCLNVSTWAGTLRAFVGLCAVVRPHRQTVCPRLAMLSFVLLRRCACGVFVCVCWWTAAAVPTAV